MYAGLPISRLEPHVFSSQTSLQRHRDVMPPDAVEEEWENFVREKKTPGVLIAPISHVWDKRDVEGLGVELGIAMKRPVGKTVLLRRLGMAHVDLPDPRAEKAAMLMGSYRSSRGLLKISSRIQEMGPPTGRGTYGSMQLSSQVQGGAMGSERVLPVRGGAPAPRRVRSLSLSSTSSSSSSSDSEYRSKRDKRRARKERRRERKNRRHEPESFLLQSDSGPPECRRCRFTLPYVYPPNCPECRAYLRPSDGNDDQETSDRDRDRDHDQDDERDRRRGGYDRERDYDRF